ncbi:hypothetical protein B0H21DRAFT_825125 [Amylocystis lapponica]|nr:hypothetical protein B0H21DRAFT_825125 [Amylocystis lapponica]
MSAAGLPLLSGPPPDYVASEASCRKCDKEFNVFFTRSRKCNHCGYAYCHSCTDFQALMPRSGSETGYDPVPVCAFCIDNLTITAAGKGHLRQLPLARLKKYANAYSLRFGGVLEKDDLIDTLIAARERNGCLPRMNEDFYRKNSVPNRRNDRPRGIFTRAMDAMGTDRPSSQPPPPPPQQRQQPSYQPRTRTTSGPSSFPRPDLDPSRYQQHPPHPPPRPRAQSPPAPRAPRPQHPPTSDFRPSSSAPHPRTASASSPAPAHVPTLDELLALPDGALGALPVGALKAVLFQNHVNARLVVEKAELVERVHTLVAAERAERGRKAAEEEAERVALEEARREREREAAGQGADAMDVDVDEDEDGEGDEVRMQEDASADAPPLPPKGATAPPPAASRLSPSAQAMASHLERTGLCVICQDEEANIAIVDCGHLAMCRPCSELIMNSSRECPLCRTRIVTEARLLRIFRS